MRDRGARNRAPGGPLQRACHRAPWPGYLGRDREGGLCGNDTIRVACRNLPRREKNQGSQLSAARRTGRGAGRDLCRHRPGGAGNALAGLGKSRRTQQEDRVKLLEDEALRELIGSREGRRIAVTSPLTPDYLIRVRRFPLFIEDPRLDDTASLRAQIVASLDRYYDEYRAFIGRVNPAAAPVDDAMIYPKAILIPGIGCICIGENEEDAAMAADIMAQGLAVKRTIYETGGEYVPLSDEHGFDMEFRAYQRAKMKPGAGDTVSGAIVLVTGAAGAIGMGICAALFEAGCQVAAADLPGAALDAAVQEFSDRFGSDRVLGTPLDVTDQDSVAQGFGRIVRRLAGSTGLS